jgi:hypothetical protein
MDRKVIWADAAVTDLEDAAEYNSSNLQHSFPKNLLAWSDQFKTSIFYHRDFF